MSSCKPVSTPSLAVIEADLAARRVADGQWLMIGGGVLLGTIGIFVEEAGTDPVSTVWFRCLFGLLALLAWGAARGTLGSLTGLRGRALGAVVAVGLLTLLNWGLFFAAIPLSSISVSTLVFHVQPFWLMALGAWWLHERVTRMQWIAAAVALLGLGLATGLLESGLVDVSGRSLLGVGLCLIGSMTYALSGLITKIAAPRVGSFALAAGQCVVGVVVLAFWPVVHGLPASGASWTWLAGLGVLHTGLAYVVLYAGMARLGTGRIALLQFVYPGTAVVVDWLVYGKALSPLQMAGVALMGGALWALRREG
ncbi:MAG: DMT family transporter [Burkholderiaceae bacterium]